MNNTHILANYDFVITNGFQRIILTKPTLKIAFYSNYDLGLDTTRRVMAIGQSITLQVRVNFLALYNVISLQFRKISFKISNTIINRLFLYIACTFANYKKFVIRVLL